jgi:hypothetical protein
MNVALIDSDSGLETFPVPDPNPEDGSLIVAITAVRF